MPHRTWALFLDVDGTLLDICNNRRDISAPSALISDLATLCRALDGAVALVSGRAIVDLDRIFAPLRLACGGQHGAEFRFSAGSEVERPFSTAIGEPLRHRIVEVAHEFPEIEIEDKGLSIALHSADPATTGPLSRRLMEVVASTDGTLAIALGTRALELHDARHSKGTAIHAFMRHPTFEHRVPVFVGDDIADENGFRAVESYGGIAMAVGDTHRAKRQTAFAAPADVRRWLRHLVGKLQTEVSTCRT